MSKTNAQLKPRPFSINDAADLHGQVRKAQMRPVTQIPFRTLWWSNSDPYRTMSYTVNEVNDFRYPGDRHERMIELLEHMKNNPPVLTERSLARRSNAKAFPKDFTPKFRVVHAAELDADYAAYTDGFLDFNPMWSSLFCYVFFKAKVEQNDFELRRRGKTEDIVQNFMLSMRQGLVAKNFKGKQGSTYHNYVNRAWFQYKCSAFAGMKAEDKIVMSGEAPDDTVDLEGNVIEGVSEFDKAVLRDFNNRSKDQRKEITALVQRASLTADKTEKIVLNGMLRDIKQKELAKQLNLSRHAISRMQAKLLARLIDMHQREMAGEFE